MRKMENTGGVGRERWVEMIYIKCRKWNSQNKIINWKIYQRYMEQWYKGLMKISLAAHQKDP